MKKLSTILVSLLVVITLSTSIATAASAIPGLSNFTADIVYTDGQFTDVTPSDWYSQYVASTYRFGLMNGTSATYFNAAGNVTIAETITLAVRLNSIYYFGYNVVEAGNPWYSPYIEYALEHGIIPEKYQDVNRPATRAEYATIISSALPTSAFPEINEVPEGSIPDVPSTRTYSDAVYLLYRAGILTGSDSKGSFNPSSNIKRSEVAAIISRVADKTQRREFSLSSSTSLDAVAIAKQCSPAVFFVEVFDSKGNLTKTGSGFFISSDGIAVTNYHVISGAYSIKIKLTTGEEKSVIGIYDYSADLDLAILQIDGEGFSYLRQSTSTVIAGEKVFAIGSPQGLDNSISDGIVSNPSRVIGEQTYIQFTAPISSGSSGGAIIDEKGYVIGISSATIAAGENDSSQNLNLAIPISMLQYLSTESFMSVEEALHSKTGWIYVETPENWNVAVGSRQYIPVYFGSDELITIECLTVDGTEKYISIEWGDFEDDYIPLYVRGISSGIGIIEINLYNQETKELLSTEYIAVNVLDASITVDITQPSVYAGSQITVTFTAETGNLDCSYYLSFEYEKDGLIECEWGEWSGNNLPLIIKGLRRGSLKLYIYLYDEYGHAITYGYIPVSVK